MMRPYWPAAVLSLAGPSLAIDWPRWRGPEGNGISKESDWKPEALSNGKVRWKANVGKGFSAVSVLGKNLYTMGNNNAKDAVYCFDAETGKQVWQYSYASDDGSRGPNSQGPGTMATPAVDVGQVYTLSRHGIALCLDVKTGRTMWQQNLGAMGAREPSWFFAGSALVAGNVIVYNAGSSGVVLSKSSGQKVWASGAGKGGYSTPVLFKHKGADCIALFGEKDLIVVDLRTAARMYSFPWVTSYDVNAADPVVFDGKVFITSGYDRGCALVDISGTAARQLWQNKNMRAHFASPVYLDGCLYGVDGQTGGGQLRCLDAKTGEVRWSQGGRFETLTVAGGKMIAMDSGGTLVAAEASPSGYKELGRASVLSGGGHKWTVPVLANGVIYCRGGEGELVAVDAR